MHTVYTLPLLKPDYQKATHMFIHFLAYRVYINMACQWQMLFFFAENFLMELW